MQISKELIRNYVRLALDNGLEVCGHGAKEIRIEECNGVDYWVFSDDEDGYNYINYIELITSKPFIENICKHNGVKDCDEFTDKQARAIRDGELEDFITKILNHE